MGPRTASAGAGGGDGVADRGAVGAAWIRFTEDDSGARRRRVAVAGVSLMGAAAVSTAVFQTVTGTSTSLAMAPGLGGLFAASTPTPQGPAVVPTGVAAPVITDLGPSSPALVAPPSGPQVDLRAQRGPLPGPGELGGGAVPAGSVPAAAVPVPAAPARPVAAGSGGGGSGGDGSPHGPGSSWPGAPGVHGSTSTRPAPPSTTTTTPPSTRHTRPHPPRPTQPTPPPRSTTPPSSTSPTPPSRPATPSSGSSGPSRSGKSGPSSGPAGRSSA